MRLRPAPVRRPYRAAALLVGALTLGLLGACSFGTESTAPPADAASDQQPSMLPSAPVEIAAAEPPACLSEGVAFGAVGAEATKVAWAGSGDRGVLLAPQVGGDACQWSDELVRLAGAGYLVATYEWGTSGRAGFEAALDVLQATGAQRVAFVGASAGGTLAAGLADDLGAVAVVALSPPAEYEGVDARAAASTFTGPLQVFSSTEDPQVPATDSAQVPRNDKSSIVTEVSGTAHGIEFLAPDNVHAEHVRTVVDEALAEGFGEG